MADAAKPEFPPSEVPVITIQCDWEDFLFTTQKEIWISCKFHGRNSKHSKMRGQGTNLPVFTTNDFSALSITRNSITIKHNETNCTCIFVAPLKTFSNVHKKNVMSIDAAEGGLGVSVCSEDKLMVWDSQTGEVRRSLNGHVSSVYKCKFFPSGIVVLSGGSDMQLKIWSAETGECPVTLIGHKASINDFCIVDRGRNIISVAKDGVAKLWDCGKSACLANVIETTNTLNCCSIGLLPQGVNPERNEPINDREIGTQDKMLLIGTEEGFVHGVAIYNRKALFELNLQSPVNVVLHCGDKFIVGCQNGKIEVYDISDVSKPIRIIHESNSPINCGCLYKNGFFVGRNDGNVVYYDCRNFSSDRISLTGSDCDPVYDIACARNDIFTACRDGKIRKYNIAGIIPDS